MLRSSTRATDPRPCFLADGERGAQWPHGDHTGAPALANPGALLHIPAGGCGCSSGVEHHVANVRVVGSNPIARSNLSVVAGAPAARTCATGRADAAQRWAPRRSQHCHPSWTGDIGDPLRSGTSVIRDIGDAWALPSSGALAAVQAHAFAASRPPSLPAGGLRRRGGRGVLSHKGGHAGPAAPRGRRHFGGAARRAGVPRDRVGPSLL